MGTHALAYVVDIEPGSTFAAPATIAAVTRYLYDEHLAGGWSRHAAYADAPDDWDLLLPAVADAGRARLVVAADFDEYGALWLVASADGGVVREVHRRYVLNADPTDTAAVTAAIDELGEDPRAEDIAGPDAAGEAAVLFGQPTGPMVQAEAGSASAYQRIGTVAAPFPWWEALGLRWPAP
ncbi:hypothetical protein [Luteipulveratus halotolerans]|uniref:Uncharacterized protein n=1 Tax=Luteipulveratus halotolerans TaxID=1631356 RepID=A0A0L6CMR7_9MICO|nr:hypothetical protein [Luteipulveratus halotolerans]KNX38848.1 hypothetical protein VV01_19660 [Luteipulveratus halotolerans]